MRQLSSSEFSPCTDPTLATCSFDRGISNFRPVSLAAVPQDFTKICGQDNGFRRLENRITPEADHRVAQIYNSFLFPLEFQGRIRVILQTYRYSQVQTLRPNFAHVDEQYPQPTNIINIPVRQRGRCWIFEATCCYSLNYLVGVTRTSIRLRRCLRFLFQCA